MLLDIAMASSRHLSADEVLALLQPAEEEELEWTEELLLDDSDSEEEQVVTQAGEEDCLEMVDDTEEVFMEDSDEEFDDLDEIEHGMMITFVNTLSLNFFSLLEELDMANQFQDNNQLSLEWNMPEPTASQPVPPHSLNDGHTNIFHHSSPSCTSASRSNSSDAINPTPHSGFHNPC